MGPRRMIETYPRTLNVGAAFVYVEDDRAICSVWVVVDAARSVCLWHSYDEDYVGRSIVTGHMPGLRGADFFVA